MVQILLFTSEGRSIRKLTRVQVHRWKSDHSSRHSKPTTATSSATAKWVLFSRRPEFSTTYTGAEQHGGAKESQARCLIIESWLPSSFWAKAIATANHIQNRCVTKSLLKGTPYEAWFNKRPDISRLRVFGSNVYVLDKDPTKGKFDPCGIPETFIDYSQNSKGLPGVVTWRK